MAQAISNRTPVAQLRQVTIKEERKTTVTTTVSTVTMSGDSLALTSRPAPGSDAFASFDSKKTQLLHVLKEGGISRHDYTSSLNDLGRRAAKAVMASGESFDTKKNLLLHVLAEGGISRHDYTSSLNDLGRQTAKEIMASGESFDTKKNLLLHVLAEGGISRHDYTSSLNDLGRQAIQ